MAVICSSKGISVLPAPSPWVWQSASLVLSCGLSPRNKGARNWRRVKVTVNKGSFTSVFKDRIMMHLRASRAKVSSVHSWDLFMSNGGHYLAQHLGLRFYYTNNKQKDTHSALWASHFPVLQQVISMMCISAGYIFLYQDEARCKTRTNMKRGAKGLRFLPIMYFDNGCGSWLDQKPFNHQGISGIVFLQWSFIFLDIWSLT